MKKMRLARMIMRMIKAMRVTGVKKMITIKLRIIRIARVITIIIRMRIGTVDDRKLIMTSMMIIMMMTT